MSIDKDDLHALSLKQRIERLEAEVAALREIVPTLKFIAVNTRDGRVVGKPSDYDSAKAFVDYRNENPTRFIGEEASIYIVRQA